MGWPMKFGCVECLCSESVSKKTRTVYMLDGISYCEHHAKKAYNEKKKRINRGKVHRDKYRSRPNPEWDRNFFIDLKNNKDDNGHWFFGKNTP